MSADAALAPSKMKNEQREAELGKNGVENALRCAARGESQLGARCGMLNTRAVNSR